MRHSAVIAGCLAFLLMPTFAGAAAAAPLRVSGPVRHDNLTIYFLHGPSQPGPVPLTLDEALRLKTVVVSETGNVNALAI